MNKDNIKLAYNTLLEAGVTNMGSLENFESLMGDSYNRKLAYETLKRAGVSNMGDFNNFEYNILGVEMPVNSNFIGKTDPNDIEVDFNGNPVETKPKTREEKEARFFNPTRPYGLGYTPDPEHPNTIPSEDEGEEITSGIGRMEEKGVAYGATNPLRFQESIVNTGRALESTSEELRALEQQVKQVTTPMSQQTAQEQAASAQRMFDKSAEYERLVEEGSPEIFNNIAEGKIGDKEFAYLDGQRNKILDVLKRKKSELVNVYNRRRENPNYDINAPKNDKNTDFTLSAIDYLSDQIDYFESLVTKADWEQNGHKAGFWQGLGTDLQASDIANVLMLGVGDYLNNKNIADRLEQIEYYEDNGHKWDWSEDERIFVDALKDINELRTVEQGLGGATSGFGAGHSIGQSLPQMAQFIAFGGLGKAAGAALGARGTALGLGKIGSTTLNVAGRAGTMMLANPQTAQGRLAGTKIDEVTQYGHTQDRSAWDRFTEAYGSTAVEYLTEVMGGFLTSKILPKGWLKTKLHLTDDNAVKQFLKRMEFHGHIEEFEEEMWSNLLTPIAQGKSWEEMKTSWGESFSKENLLITALATAAMSGPMVIASAGAGTAQATHWRKKANKAFDSINDGNLKQQVSDALKLNSTEDTMKALSKIDWSSVQDIGDVQNAWEYIQYKTYTYMAEGAEVSEAAKENAEAKVALVEGISHRGIVETGEYDGQQVYVRSEDTEGAVVVTRMDGTSEQVAAKDVKNRTYTPLNEAVSAIYQQEAASAEEAAEALAEDQDKADAEAAGVPYKSSAEAQREFDAAEGREAPNVELKAGDIVTVDGKEGEVVSVDAYTKTARVEIDGQTERVPLSKIVGTQAAVEAPEQTEVVPSEEGSSAVEQPTEEGVEAEAPMEVAAPKIEATLNEAGEVDVKATGEEQTANYLVQELETPEEAIGYANDKIAEAQKTLKKAQSNEKLPLNIAERKKVVAERKAEAARLEEEIAMWEGVKNRLSQPQQSAEVAPEVESAPVAEAEVTTPQAEVEQAQPNEQTISDEQGVVEQPTAPVAAQSEQSTDIHTREQVEGMAWKAGVVRNNESKRYRFTDVLDKIAKSLGVRIAFVDEVEEGGLSANGLYTSRDGKRTIYIATNRARGVQFVVGHEILHHLKTISPKAYEQFVKAVMKEMGEEGFAANLNNLRKTYQRAISYATMRGENPPAMPSDEVLAEEVVADYVGSLISATDGFTKFVKKHKGSKFMQALRSAIQHIRSFFKGTNAWERAMDRRFAEFENLLGVATGEIKPSKEVKKLTEAMAPSKEVVEAAETIPNTQGAESKMSLMIAPTLEAQSAEYFSKYYQGKNAAARFRPVSKVMSEEALKVGNDAISAMVEIMTPHIDEVVFGKRLLPEEVYGKGYTTIFKNGSYGRSMENTTNCVRTLAYNEFVDEVKKQIGRPLTTAESFLASQMLYDIAKDPQCLYCYVSLDRKAYDEFLLRYMQERDVMLKQYAEMEDKSPEAMEALYNTYLNGRKDTKPMRERFNKLISIVDNGGTLISGYDLMTREKRNEMRETSEDMRWQIEDAEKYAQGASWAKKEEEYRAYAGEILKMPFSIVKQLSEEYGLRFYSFSEYTPAFIVENMQMVRDAALRGLRGFAYTKEVDFVKIFAPTGMNMNVSTFGRVDSEGNVVPDERQGASWEEVKALREQYPNVGATFVATNDAMVEWALAQDWIDVVIPFHIVRTGADVAEFYKWTNYSSQQSDIKDGKKADIMPTEHHNNLETYLALCEERGITPRFSQWRENPNYMKLVNETRRSVDETPVLQPTFNLEAAQESWNNFVEKGGYYGGWYEVDEQGFNEAVEQVASDIEAGKSAKDVDYGRQDIPADYAERARQARVNRAHGNTPKLSIKEMDAPYLEAVGRGDMETAQRMVDEAARLAEYSTDESWRMQHRAPVRDEENSNPFNTEKIVPEDYWEHPEWYSDIRRNASTRESFYNMLSAIRKYKQLVAEGKQEEADKVTVKMYRGVDKTANKREGSFRNGDWITPSRSYAVESAPYGKARVIEQEVPLKNIWWDGNSMNEWGYDDGSNYTYRDTKNNRKLLDPVTYDDNGNVIPLSERFNPRKEDVRFSIMGERGAANLDATDSDGIRFSLREVNDRFNEQLATLTEDNKDRVILSLGMPSDILRAAGVVNKPMKLYGNKVIKKQKDHGFQLDELQNLPIAVAYPIAVFNNYNADDNRSILTELRTKDGNFLVSLNIGKDQDIDFNIVASVFGKDDNNVVGWFNKGYATYIDKEKALNYLHHSAPIAEALSNSRQDSETNLSAPIAEALSQEIISATNIVQKFENPSIEPKLSLRNTDTFYSNAEFAVRNIKQEKATPEQWLKMIEKAGGLKAGEDKWLGLSDWLKESKAKTLTKQEVLDYINANKIVVEEVEYGDIENTARFKELQEEFRQLYYENDYNGERAMEAMVDKYGDDFTIAFTYAGDNLIVEDTFGTDAAEAFIGANSINETRSLYTTDGLENKREIALVVPTIEPWKADDNIHFGDAGEGRAVAWVRFGEAEDEYGYRTLVIDEIQSNRHQEGREKGYRDTKAEERENAEREKELVESVLPRVSELNTLFNEKYGEGKWWDVEYDAQWRSRRVYRYLTPEEQAEYEALLQRASELQTPMPKRDGIPSAPFDKNWHEVAMKRILRYAAENGYDKVAWTTGNQQAERYSIGGAVESIDKQDSYNADEQRFKVTLKATESPLYLTTNNEGVVVHTLAQDYMGKNLSDIFGKEIAVKMLGAKENSTISGDGLRIGGEGMRAFYDQILPNFMNKYGKKWGVKVGEVTMPDLAKNNTMHSVYITPAMRESVMQGQPLFSLRLPEYQESFKALSEEYNALDKNDAEAVADFRARKREVVEAYWNDLAKALGADVETIVVDSTNNPEALRPIYDKLKEAAGNDSWFPSFRKFVRSMQKAKPALYIAGTNTIGIDIARADKANTLKDITQLFLHENIHRIVVGSIDRKQLIEIWSEVGKTDFGKRIKKAYKRSSSSVLGNESLAYRIAGTQRTDINPLLDFIEGNNGVSVEDVLAVYENSLPLRDKVVKQILNILRNEYKEKGAGAEAAQEAVKEADVVARKIARDGTSSNRGRGRVGEEAGDLRVDGESRKSYIENGRRITEIDEDFSEVEYLPEFDEQPKYSLRDPIEQIRMEGFANTGRKKDGVNKADLPAAASQYGKESLGRKVERAVFNHLVDVERLQENLYAAGVEKTDDNDFINAFEAVRNVVAAKMPKEYNKYIQPLLDIIIDLSGKEYGFSYTDVSDYLAAKHSIEREDVSDISTMSEEEGAKWTRERCEEIVSEFESKVPAEIQEKLWDAVRAIEKRTLDILLDAGVYTEADVEAIQSHGWEYYVPLQGWDAAEENLIEADKIYDIPRRGGSTGGKWQEHSAKGRRTKPYDPIGTIVSKLNKALYVAETNNALKKLYNLVSDGTKVLGKDEASMQFKASEAYYRSTPEGYVEIDPDDVSQEELKANRKLHTELKKLYAERKKAKKEGDEARVADLDAKIADVKSQLTIFIKAGDMAIPREISPSQELTRARRVYFYINGRRMYIQFTNPKYSSAINGQTIVQRNDFDNWHAGFVGWISRSFTTNNPYFAYVTNPIRDFRDAMNWHFMDVDNGNLGGFVNHYVFHWNSTRNAIYRAQRGNANPLTSEELKDFNILNKNDRRAIARIYGRDRLLDTLFEWFAENGGVISYKKAFKTPAAAKNFFGQPKKVKAKDFNGHANVYEALQDSAEIITRYATFLASLDKGQSVGQAVANGRNVSVNFNRKGELSNRLGAYYSFFNASMQGIYKYIKLARKNKWRFAALAGAQAAMGYIGSLLTDWLYTSLFPDNDDDELTNVEIPLWERLGYTVIPIWRANGKVHTIRIPKSQNMSAFSAIGVLINEMIKGRIAPKEAIEAELNQLAAAWTYGFSEGAPLLRSVVPTGLPQIAFDLWNNTDAFGREIYRTDKYDTRLPAVEFGKKNVSPWVYEVCSAINKAAGGNEYRSSGKLTDINPSAAQYLMEQLAGGYGTMARQAMEFTTSAFYDEVEFETQNIPALGRLMYTVEPKSWYPEYDEIRKGYDAAASKNAKSEAASGYITMEELQDKLIKSRIYKAHDKHISDLRKLRDEHPSNSGAYEDINREINRQMGLVVKLFEEIDWSADVQTIKEQREDIIQKYVPYWKENITNLYDEYAK